MLRRRRGWEEKGNKGERTEGIRRSKRGRGSEEENGVRARGSGGK